MKLPKLFLSIVILLMSFYVVPVVVEAAAPLRSQAYCTAQGIVGCPTEGRPYAEAALCARADVILCEDFNHSDMFFYSGTIGSFDSWWKNPAVATNITDSNAGCGISYGGFSYNIAGRSFTPQSSVQVKPQGAMPSGSQPDYVYTMNWDSTKGTTGPGQTQGFLFPNPAGSTFCNGNARSKDFYIRMQVYVTPNFVWPGGYPKPNTYGHTYTPCLDTKFFGFYPFEGYSSPTDAAFDGSWNTNCDSGFVRFSDQGVGDPSGIHNGDAINIRYGNGGTCGYPQFPAWASNQNNICKEYRQYKYNNTVAVNLNADPHDTPLACTFSPSRPYYCTSGQVHRMDRGKWYTHEIHFRLSSVAGANDGIVEFWVDGVRIAAADDMQTCQSGLGSNCLSIGYIQILNYHNRNNCPTNCNDVTPFTGQAYYDNLVIAGSYIGPPGGSAPVDTTPPAKVTGVSVE